MRSAKKSDNFPYCMKTLCYFEVDRNGNVSQLNHKNKSDRPEVMAAYQRAANQTTTLYAVWPGNWSSDLFVIDDLDTFAKKFELT